MFGAIGLAVLSGLGCRYTHPGHWNHLPFRGHWPYLLGSNNVSCSRTNDWQLSTYFRRTGRIPVFIPYGIKASLCVKEDSEGLRIRVPWRKSGCLHCSTWSCNCGWAQLRTVLQQWLNSEPSWTREAGVRVCRTWIPQPRQLPTWMRVMCWCLPLHASGRSWLELPACVAVILRFVAWGQLGSFKSVAWNICIVLKVRVCLAYIQGWRICCQCRYYAWIDGWNGLKSPAFIYSLSSPLKEHAVAVPRMLIMGCFYLQVQ
jgi:hypothetical protein